MAIRMDVSCVNFPIGMAVYIISRNELSEFAKRNDSENTGVYFLFGKDESNFDTVYVGEAEKMFTRLKQHLKEDYWNDCIAITY